MNYLNTKLGALFLCLSVIVLNIGIVKASSTEQEVTGLLEHLSKSSCQFIRNGKNYSGTEAAKHLAGKYEYAKKKIHSAESFIENIASESYFSGKPYRVNCLDHASVKSDEWLTELLIKQRESVIKSDE